VTHRCRLVIEHVNMSTDHTSSFPPQPLPCPFHPPPPQCPSKTPIVYATANATISVGPGAADVDTTGATANTVCALDLTVTDGAGRTASASTNVTASPPGGLPPIATIDSAPYTLTAPYTSTAIPGVGATGSTCSSTPCTYDWTLACPGAASNKTYTGVSPTITTGPDGASDIDWSGATSPPLVCALDLVVTDSNSASSTASTTISVK
jgi:hypothetical protein